MSNEADTGSGWRLPALDGVRGSAALCVLVGHVAQEAGADGRTIVGAWLRYGGQGGVVLFFVLSGFLLFLPWLRSPAPTFRQYAARRCLRIMPAYYFSVAVLAFWLRPGPIPVIFHLLFLPSFTFTLLPVYWTLQVEEFFYWSLPVLARLVIRWGALSTLILSFLLAAVYFICVLEVLPHRHWFLFLSQTPFYLPAFASGIAAAVAWHKGFGAKWLAGVAPLSYLLISPLAEHYRFVSATDAAAKIALPLCNLLLVPGATAVVLAAASGNLRWFGIRPLRFVGRISLSLYLWHYLVIQYAPVPTAFQHSITVRVAYTLLLSVPIAYLLYRWIEVPFLRLRPVSHPRVEKLASSTHATL